MFVLLKQKRRPLEILSGQQMNTAIPFLLDNHFLTEKKCTASLDKFFCALEDMHGHCYQLNGILRSLTFVHNSSITSNTHPRRQQASENQNKITSHSKSNTLMHNPCHQVTKKGERAPLKYVLLQPMENGRRKSGVKKNRIRICVKLPFFKEIAPADHITNPN